MSARILVIDDDEHMRGVMVRMLSSAGHEILEAENGKVGTRLYREQPVDLIITDLIMPEQEGIETIRELRKENPAVKIIAVSGGGAISPEQYLTIAKHLGVVQTLSKPFRKQELLDAVNACLAPDS